MPSRRNHQRPVGRLAAVPQSRRSTSGYALPAVAASLLVLLGALALAIDMGSAFLIKAKLQDMLDATALSSASLVADSGSTDPTSQVLSRWLNISNMTGAVMGVDPTLQASDVTTGRWSAEDETFVAVGIDGVDHSSSNAVSLSLSVSVDSDSPASFFLGAIASTSEVQISVSSTAYVGAAGSICAEELFAPFAIGCCAFGDGACGLNYCSSGSYHAFATCDLTNIDSSDDDASCLEFRNRSAQNACWTIYGDPNNSVNTNRLRNYLRYGPSAGGGDACSSEVSLDEYELNDGRRTSVVREFRNKFEGSNFYSGSPAGTDRYAPFDGDSDSWVMPIAIVECESSGRTCRSGQEREIVGFGCAEIRQVTNNTIKLRMLCSGEPLFEECEIAASESGGVNFGLSASQSMLVH